MEIFPLGDSAIVIRLGASIDEATHRRVRALCARLEERPVPGMTGYVPAFASVTVHYDPARVGPAAAERGAANPYDRVAAALAPLLERLDTTAPLPAREVEVPVVYGGEFGPDLDTVAAHAGLSPDDVVALHASAEYRVSMIGFAPGFPYLAGLPERIAAPRRPTPRTVVPPGSVGIAGRQTGIYPIESPGGWQIIGRTPARLFAPDLDPPALLRVGDRVRFRPIAAEAWADAAAQADGAPQPGRGA
ncbi:MAG TPA: 5-oxoprolinase subunit PxpB [Longimicrobiales bacterium]